MLELFNSLTKQLEKFKPIKEGQVGLYTCGPTVYDQAHIGNFRTYVFEDLLRRTLAQNGYKIVHVMNITDVDDKTIKRSRLKYPDDEPAEALAKLTKYYEKVFYADAKKLAIGFTNSQIAKATDHIADMQSLILGIPNKYISGGGIYFDIEKYPEYGVLVKLDRAHTHHRIQNDEYDKDHVADFALWKSHKEGEPKWDFEIGNQNIAGRPGWHIECSAMSAKYLGVPFDIHTGGVDLKFPHHENEIAQTKSATGKNIANTFLHVEHLLVGGHKMSKSLNNFYTLGDIAKKAVDPLAFRLLVLQAHYRSQLNFSWKSIEAAQTNLHKLYSWADQMFQTGKLPAAEPAAAEKLRNDIKSALNSDLNSAKALAALNDYVGRAAPNIALLNHIDSVFGFNLSQRMDISDGQKQLIAGREAARESEDWAKADELRQELAKGNIEVRDTDHGPIWHRTN